MAPPSTKAAKKNAKRAAKRAATREDSVAKPSAVSKDAPVAIMWFRDDLRLTDNPALSSAASCSRVVPFFCRDDEGSRWPVSGAAAHWVHHSLLALDKSLKACGAGLVCHRGDALSGLLDVISATGAEAVYWNNTYQPRELDRDEDIEAVLTLN